MEQEIKAVQRKKPCYEIAELKKFIGKPATVYTCHLP